MFSQKILIADDDKDIVEYLKSILASLLPSSDFDITEAYNGKEAIDHLKKEAFSFVLLDIKMPKKDGISVIKEIRSGNSFNKDTPIIVISGFLDEVSINQSKVFYLNKPIEDYSFKTMVKMVAA